MEQLTGATTLLEGRRFLEGLRWRDGAVWCSDIDAREVLRVQLDGTAEVIARFDDDEPSGLGWLPNGDLVVVAMHTRQLRRVDSAGRISVHADLSNLAVGDCNDMVSRGDGTCWVGDMGFAVKQGPQGPIVGQTLVVRPDGSTLVGASDLLAPNGHVLGADDTQLVVAESAASRLTAFDVAEDGTISNRRLFADLAQSTGERIAPPDGICGDAAGAIWVADPIGRQFRRVVDGGAVSHTIVPENAAAITSVLAGGDRRLLVMAVAAALPGAHQLPVGNSRLEMIEVEVPGAGAP